MKAWQKVLIAAAIGAAAMGLTSTVAYAATQKSDPSFASLGRNSAIAAVVSIGVGIYVAAKKNPAYGIAIATGGAALLISTRIAGFLGKLVTRPTTAGIAAVFGNMGAWSRQMSGYERRMNAVYAQMNGMGAVYAQMGAGSGWSRRMNGIGQGYMPEPNWKGSHPFS